MNRADTYKQIADYFTGLGTLFEVLAAESAAGPARPAGPGSAASAPASTFSDGTPVDEPDIPFDYELPPSVQPATPQGSLGQCPKHKVEYADGRYGPYCKQQSDEGPDWANAKGYCRITPKNAAAWLRQHAGAAA